MAMMEAVGTQRADALSTRPADAQVFPQGAVAEWPCGTARGTARGVAQGGVQRVPRTVELHVILCVLRLVVLERLLQDGERLARLAHPVAHEAQAHVDAAPVAVGAAFEQFDCPLEVLLRLWQVAQRRVGVTNVFAEGC